MKSATRFLPILISVIVLSLGACAGSPPRTSESDLDLGIRIVPERELSRRFNTIDRGNPFAAPRTLLDGAPDFFVVIEISPLYPLSLGFENLRVELLDGANRRVGSALSREQLEEYWDAWFMEEQDAKLKRSNIRRYYLETLAPKRPSTAKRLLVCLGKNPAPQNGLVKVDVFTTQGSKQFELLFP